MFGGEDNLKQENVQEKRLLLINMKLGPYSKYKSMMLAPESSMK